MNSLLTRLPEWLTLPRQPGGAHLGVWTDDDRVLHLCAEIGMPEVWTLTQFAARERYRTWIGFKRCHPAGQRTRRPTVARDQT